MRALSIRQPHAEAIMRGVKKIEYRTRPTKVRGRIYSLVERQHIESETVASGVREHIRPAMSPFRPTTR